MYSDDAEWDLPVLPSDRLPQPERHEYHHQMMMVSMLGGKHEDDTGTGR